MLATVIGGRGYDSAVANTYAANFGDVAKHAVLGEVVVRERPARYLESHGGRLDYDLAELDPGPGGVWDFLELGADRAVLASCSYARVLAEVAGSRHEPGTYPGSIALAASLLPPDSEVIAFELVDSSAADLSERLAARGRSATVHVAEGLGGVRALARPGDLVLLDPFHVHERAGELTAAETFETLASRDIATILWYAIYDPAEFDWPNGIIGVPDRSRWRTRLIGDTTEGGLAGCGFLTAHLSSETVAAVASIVEELARTLAPVRPGLRAE